MKRTVSVLVAIVLYVASGGISAASVYSDAVLADDPFVYYRFEESAGPTAVNMGSLGAAGDGTYVGPVTLGTTGADAPLGLGNSVGFLGGATYVDVPDLGSNHAQLSVEMWVKVDVNANLPGCCTSLYSTDSFNTADGSSLHFNIKGGRDVEHAMAGGGPQNVNTPGGLIPNDVWRHIVATYDQTNSGETKIYVDGNLEVTVNRPAAGPFDLSDTGQIGTWNGGRQLPGYADEFAFYDSILDQQQVQAHFDAASNVIPEPSTFLLAILGLLGLLGFGRRRK